MSREQSSLGTTGSCNALLLSRAGAAGEEEQEAQSRISLLGNPGQAGSPLMP